jgi:hypothetical protein
MKGDFSKNTFRREKHYGSVRMQQGRVTLDADFNEQVDIQKHLKLTAFKDIIGCCGVPKKDGGFAIGVVSYPPDLLPDLPPDLTISPGRFYAAGTLCELEATPLEILEIQGSPEKNQVRLPALTVDGREFQALTVDGDKFQAGQWVEVFAEGVPPRQFQIDVGGIDSSTKTLTLRDADLSGSLVEKLGSETPPMLRRITTYLTQPDYPDPPDLSEDTDDGIYLAYLDVWSRHVTAIEDPQIREVALKGADTATRAQTIRQVKVSWVSPLSVPPTVKCPDFGCEWAPEGALSQGKLRACAEPDTTSDEPCIVPDKAGYRRIENQLYRVEIHDGGVPYVWQRPPNVQSTDVAKIDLAENDDPVAGEITLEAWTVDWLVGQVIEMYSKETDDKGQPGALFRIAGVDKNNNKLTLQTDESLDPNANLSDFLVGHTNLRIRQVATFKWSRENGSVVFSIEEKVSNTQVKVRSLGRDDVLALAIGDWVELSDDVMDLKGGPGFMARITDISEAERLVTLDRNISSLDFNDLNRHPKLRRWDQSSNVVAVKDGWIPLESGVEIEFDGDYFVTGDYWQIPARTDTRDVEWPQDELITEPLEKPLFQPPQGIEHHYCPLALLEYDGSSWTVREDCRRPFPTLTDIYSCCVMVQPGEDLQLAVDTVIAAGGGHVRLCRGVHEVTGQLRLDNAHQLTLIGDDSATTLRLRLSQTGEGGVILQNCNRVAIENLFIVSDDVPVLIDVNPTWPEGEFSRNILFRHLTLLNLATSQGCCAVSLVYAEDIVIEDCRMIADVGIQCPLTWHQQFLITNLHMQRSYIRYQVYGIESLGSVDWRLNRCDIRCSDPDGLNQLRDMEQGNLCIQEFHWGLLQEVDKLILSEQGAGSGTAISAVEWVNCTLSDSYLQGLYGLNVLWWEDSAAMRNTVYAENCSFFAWGLWNTHWCDNEVVCESGIGLSFDLYGDGFFHIEHNHIRAAVGLTNQTQKSMLSRLGDYLDQIVRTHPLPIPSKRGPLDPPESPITPERAKTIALWMLLEKWVSRLGLEDVKEKAQQFFEALGFQRYPVLFTVSTHIYQLLVQGKLDLNLPLPVFDLEVRGNSIEGDQYCILLENFTPGGGITIADNYLSSPAGQAISICPVPVAASANDVGALWQSICRELAQQSFPTLKNLIREGSLGDDVKSAAGDLLDALAAKASAWADQSEQSLENDYRIEANEIISQGTAIEANLFDLTILNNHISLTQQARKNEDISRIKGVLSANSITRPLVVAMKDGFTVSPADFSERLITETNVFSKPDVQSEVSNTIFSAGKVISDEQMRAVSSSLGTAVAAGDVQATMTHVKEFANLLRESTTSFGIAFKGANGRIIGNRILVTQPENPNGWARGGVYIWGGDPYWKFPSFVKGMLVVQQEPPTPFVECVIADNEIVGGYGHGIDIQGLDLADINTLYNLKISGNQIRGKAGAGIAVDEEALVTGIDIEHNLIADCTTVEALTNLNDVLGGVNIVGARFCRIHNNRITRCGMFQNVSHLFGIDLDTIEFGLSVEGNHISYNGIYNGDPSSSLINGGIRLKNIYGEAGVCNNEILANRGLALSWGVVSSRKILSTSEWSRLFSTEEETSPWCRTSIQGNRIQVEPALHPPALILISDLWQLNFSGNNCDSAAESVIGILTDIDYGIIANNILYNTVGNYSLKVSNIQRGVIIGNVSGPGRPICLVTSSPDVKSDHNVPDVIRTC